MPQWWMCFLSLLIAAITTGSIPSELDKDVLDAIARETFVVRTWTENHHLNSITVTKGDIIRLSAFFYTDKNLITKDPKGVLMLKYNNATIELMFENVSKENEGIYNLEETLYDTKQDQFERKAGKWIFQLNVVEQHEVKECNVGENIVMKFTTSSLLSHLYYYDQTVAFFMESDCNVGTRSHLYGRLWCCIDNDMYTIRIQNATQRDAGLYKVVKDNSVIKRFFLNITDQPTYATTGGNVTIGWFYSQQGINRTLRIIHSNKGIMMMLPPTNDPNIMRDFQERVLYSGDISRSYMSFTLINLETLDSGVYTVETLHGNTIPGSKHLIVQDRNDAYDIPLTDKKVIPESTSVFIERTGHNIKDMVANILYIPPFEVVDTPKMDLAPSGKTGTHVVVNIAVTDTSTTRGPSPVTSAEILDSEENTVSLPHTVKLTSSGIQSISYHRVVTHQSRFYFSDDDTDTVTEEDPYTFQTPSVSIYVIYVVSGAMGLILLMLCCLIFIQRRNTYSLKAVQRFVLETYSSTPYAAPSTTRNQLPTSIIEEQRMGHLIQSSPIQNAQSVLKCLAIPENSPSLDTKSSFTISIQKLENNKPGLICENIVTCKESNKRSIEMLSDACDKDMRDLMEECPTVCILDSAAGNEVLGPRQPIQFPHDLYAKVKKGPRSASKNKNGFGCTSKIDGLCMDGYEMVNIARGNDPRSTSQDVEIVSESTKPVSFSSQETDNSRTNYVHEANEDDGYETCGNIAHMTYLDNVKVSEDEDAMTVKDQEPKECMIIPSVRHSDYADIDI